MQSSDQALQGLAQCFLESLSHEAEPRKRAEANLKALAAQPGYCFAVLRVVSAPEVDQNLRWAAAVNFKNQIKYKWSPTELDQERMGEIVAMQDGEKEQIKAHIVELMLSTPPRIQAQLSEALAIISTHDFPAKWNNLLPELITKLDTTDYTVINGVLETANSIFQRFRDQYKSNELYVDLKYCLDKFAPPMLVLFQKTGQLILASANVGDNLKRLVQSQKLVAQIFYSLNSQELPEFFEDHMKEWMTEFHRYLTYQNSLLEETDEVSVLDELKAAICVNINLYMEKNEEEFKGYLPGFVIAVWNLLMSVGLTTKHDQLAITAINFLTTVSKSVYHTVFSDPTNLQTICEGIVIPNLRFREEDEELFQDNFLDYIRRDMEGSDSDTRRRMACELVKGLASHYEKQITDVFSQHVGKMLADYATNPEENWKAKDCAIYLVVALAVRQKTEAAGATSVNELVNVGDFLSNQVLPEMNTPDVNKLPVLKADALKFLTTFRTQLPKARCLELFPQLIRLIQAESNVVHSYAANCIERFLVVKDGGKPRFTSADLQPFVKELLAALFGGLRISDSNENQYIMKCIMRVISIADLGPLAPPIISELSAILVEVCKNPKNPYFNHYLFEAVAGLVRKPSAADPTQIAVFENTLFPFLQMILVNDVQEFSPYAFQILAILVETRKPPLPDVYMSIFSALISPQLWERPANVPALVRVLQAYLEKAAPAIVSANQLLPVLGVFHKLIASKHTDHHGFYVLNTVVEYLTPDVLSPYMKQIWNLLFFRLQDSRTPKFVRGLLIFMALFVGKHGTGPLLNSVNSVQPGLFLQLIDPVWVSTLPIITGSIETKLSVVAATKLLTEWPDLQVDATLPLWGRLLNSTVTLAVRPEEERAVDVDIPDELDEVAGYQAVFAQLYNAGKKEEDPIPDIRDAKEYLARGIGGVYNQAKEKFTGAIGAGLTGDNQKALQELCARYGVRLA